MTRRAIVLKAIKQNRRRRCPRMERSTTDQPDHDRFYVIEKLIDKRRNYRRHRIEYLVRWKNYPPSDDTWEPEEEIMINAKAMIKEYENSQTSDSEDETVHCLCKIAYNSKKGGMVQCTNCNTWYHFECIKMNMEDANSILRYYCRTCKRADPQLKTVLKPEKVNLFCNRSISEL